MIAPCGTGNPTGRGSGRSLKRFTTKRCGLFVIPAKAGMTNKSKRRADAAVAKSRRRTASVLTGLCACPIPDKGQPRRAGNPDEGLSLRIEPANEGLFQQPPQGGSDWLALCKRGSGVYSPVGFIHRITKSGPFRGPLMIAFHKSFVSQNMMVKVQHLLRRVMFQVVSSPGKFRVFSSTKTARRVDRARSVPATSCLYILSGTARVAEESESPLQQKRPASWEKAAASH